MSRGLTVTIQQAISFRETVYTKALKDLGELYASTNTATILIVFSKFGIVPGLFYTFNMIKAVKNISNNKNTLMLIFAFIAMTSGISLIESIIFNIILFYRGIEYDKNTMRIGENEKG